ncbi:uncharacterized protein LOC141717026 isoform X1 [Apium graveolens]|uniref:uncharacterized protein LOC141717026 isoform X1 n=1 Tax=Apium graveolens TaxID=4045 RepID=UPI003D7BCAC1
MMIYNKGSRVEILCEDELPSGAWRCAEIICGDGYNFKIRYDEYFGAAGGETVVKWISNKLIRPCPPQIELKDDWIRGAVLEVFHNLSWKMATVSKVLGNNLFVVRLVGSSSEFKVRRLDLRMRQCWQNNEWTVIEKGCGSDQAGKRNDRLNLIYVRETGSQGKEIYIKMRSNVLDQYLDAEANVNQSCNPYSRNLKRSFRSCQVEQQEGSAYKYLAAEKEGKSRRVAASPSPKKVEAIASAKQILGEKHLHASNNYRTTRLFETGVEREKPNGAFGCLHAVNVDHNDADNIACSVGSCSVNSNSPLQFPYHSKAFEDNEGCYSNAEYSCWLGCKEKIFLPPTKEELTEKIHSLELHAYRSTIGAFHAAGPLSWEQETLVTDLRISLHISNDEHLLEIKNLMSTTTSVSCR